MKYQAKFSLLKLIFNKLGTLCVILSLCFLSACSEIDMCFGGCFVASDDFGYPRVFVKSSNYEMVDTSFNIVKPIDTGFIVRDKTKRLVMKLHTNPYVLPFSGSDKDNATSDDVPDFAKDLPKCLASVKMEEENMGKNYPLEYTPDIIPCTLRRGKGLYMILMQEEELEKLSNTNQKTEALNWLKWRVATASQWPKNRLDGSQIVHLGVLEVLRDKYKFGKPVDPKTKEGRETEKEAEKIITYKLYPNNIDPEHILYDLIVYDIKQDQILNTPIIDSGEQDKKMKILMQITTQTYDTNVGGYTLGFLSGASGAVGLGVDIVEQLISGANEASKNLYQHITQSSWLSFFVITGVTIYIIWKFSLLLIGNPQVSIKSLMKECLKLITVTILITSESSWTFFNTYVFSILNDLVTQIQVGLNGTESGPLDFMVGFTFSRQFFLRLLALFQISNPWSWIYFIALFILTASLLVAMLRGYIQYGISMICFWLVVAISPIMISLIIFDKTTDMMVAWAKSLLFYTAQSIFLFAILSTTGSVAEYNIRKYMGFEVKDHKINLGFFDLKYPVIDVSNDTVETLSPVPVGTSGPYEVVNKRYAKMLNLYAGDSNNEAADAIDVEIAKSMNSGQFVFMELMLALGMLSFITNKGVLLVPEVVSMLMNTSVGIIHAADAMQNARAGRMIGAGLNAVNVASLGYLKLKANIGVDGSLYNLSNRALQYYAPKLGAALVTLPAKVVGRVLAGPQSTKSNAGSVGRAINGIGSKMAESVWGIRHIGEVLSSAGNTLEKSSKFLESKIVQNKILRGGIGSRMAKSERPGIKHIGKALSLTGNVLQKSSKLLQGVVKIAVDMNEQGVGNTAKDFFNKQMKGSELNQKINNWVASKLDDEVADARAGLNMRKDVAKYKKEFNENAAKASKELRAGKTLDDKTKAMLYEKYDKDQVDMLLKHANEAHKADKFMQNTIKQKMKTNACFVYNPTDTRIAKKIQGIEATVNQSSADYINQLNNGSQVCVDALLNGAENLKDHMTRYFTYQTKSIMGGQDAKLTAEDTKAIKGLADKLSTLRGKLAEIDKTNIFTGALLEKEFVQSISSLNSKEFEIFVKSNLKASGASNDKINKEFESLMMTTDSENIAGDNGRNSSSNIERAQQPQDPISGMRAARDNPDTMRRAIRENMEHASRPPMTLKTGLEHSDGVNILSNMVADIRTKKVRLNIGTKKVRLNIGTKKS